MFYVYALKMANDEMYIGLTTDLRKRIREHKKSKVFTTKKYLPVELIYYEAFLSREDAKEREFKLKRYGSSWSNLKKRIKKSLDGSQERG